MELLSKEVFKKLLIEAASELDAELEREAKEIIKRHLREKNRLEESLEKFNDLEVMRKYVNENVHERCRQKAQGGY